MKKPEFPTVPLLLIRELENKFRDTIPDAGTAVDFKVLQGEQRVVRFLRAQYEKQNPSFSEN